MSPTVRSRSKVFETLASVTDEVVQCVQYGHSQRSAVVLANFVSDVGIKTGATAAKLSPFACREA